MQALQEEMNAYLRRLGVGGSELRYRYFQQRGGPMFCWSTEKVDGRYASFVYRPIGKGARTGKATRWERVDSGGRWKLVTHSTRKAAKARALRLYRKHQG